jgi:hypothetical protein
VETEDNSVRTTELIGTMNPPPTPISTNSTARPPFAIIFIAIFFFLNAVIRYIIPFANINSPGWQMPRILATSAAGFIFHSVIGVGLLRMKRWAYLLAMVVMCLGLMKFGSKRIVVHDVQFYLGAALQLLLLVYLGMQNHFFPGKSSKDQAKALTAEIPKLGWKIEVRSVVSRIQEARMSGIYPYLIVILIALIGVGLGLKLLMNKRSQTKTAAEPQIHLVSAEAAARRALCLHVMIQRSNLEFQSSLAKNVLPGQLDKVMGEYQKACDHLNKFVETWGLGESLSKREKILLEQKIGKWKEQDIKDASWEAESLLVIEWALGVNDQIPAYDQAAEENIKEVKELLSTQKPKEFVSGAKLRPETEISRARDIAELWLWRARTTQIQKDPKRYPPPKGWTYEKIIQATVEKAEAEGVFKNIGNDFPAYGKSYRDLTEQEHSLATSLARERLRGLNWLCGYAQDWDEVPTDT